MQNWNQWQLSAGAVTTPMPQPPVGYAAPGADPMAMMQAYMQYYNQPAPSGYTPEQWAAAQQQNWAQWQQWQQQYQQWQAQYGEKYQETMKQMSAQNLGLMNQAPPLPNVQQPPLPKEDTKPPLPPNTINAYQFTSMPPPHQNNLPLFPAKQPSNSAVQNLPNCPQNPPLPSSQPPLPPESSSSNSAESSDSKETVTSGKRASSTVSESSSAKKLKTEEDDLTEAEKTFDAQFKQWEEQFNKWKQQNANHPDKTQYKQYEAKWTSWREKLIERREQMRKKREQQRQAAAKQAEADKSKSLPGDDKILNILSNTENQGLINNLLGIGKTLGLTGKQNTGVPPPPPPPPATHATASQSTTLTSSSQGSAQAVPQPGPSTSSNTTQSSWNSQQWASQYNAGMNASNFPANLQSMTGVPPPPFGTPQTQLPPPNFNQPPPNFPGAPNFSQPPPGFNGNDLRRNRPPIQPNVQGRPPFGSNDMVGPDAASLGSIDHPNQPGNVNNFDPNQPGPFGLNEFNRQKDAAPDRFGRDNANKNMPDYPGNQPRPNDSFGPRNENFKLNDDRGPDSEHFNREDRGYQDQGSNRFNSQRMNFNAGNDRFPPGNDRFGQGSDHCGPNNDRFGQGNDRFGPGGNRFGQQNDRYGPGSERFGADRFGPGIDRAGPGNDRFGPGNERFGYNERFGPNGDRFGSGDRFGPNHDRFGPGNDRLSQGSEPNSDRFSAPGERFGPGNEFSPGGDKFNRNTMDRFDQKDSGENRRDSFSSNNRGFNRQFEPSDELAPELKKLMEKRRAAMDVFKPSFLDLDRNSASSSLSESFKKIAGDSPFVSKNLRDSPQKDYGPKGNNFGPRGMPNFGPGGPGFRMPGPDFRPGGEFKPQGGPPDFGPRGLPGFYPRGNAFDSRDGNAPNFRPPADFDERITIDHKSNVPDTKPEEKNTADGATAGKPDPLRGNVPVDKKETEAPEQKGPAEKLEHQADQGGNKGTSENIPLLEKPPWVGAEFPEGNLPQKSATDQSGESTSAQDNENAGREQESDANAADKKNVTNSGDGVISKKSDVLPFMGENDPKPEDLNMEPPPELPNLGPIPSNINNEPADTVQRVDESFDSKGPVRTFPPNPGPRGPFDCPPGPRCMPFNPNGPPPFEPRGPNSARFPTFDPRTPAPFPFNSSEPNSRQLGTQLPNEGQFGPRGAEDGQFGPRGPTDTPFRPRGPADGQFGPRGPNYKQLPPCRPDAPFMNRTNDTQFGPKGPTEGQFGFPGPSDRFFGTRRPNDGQRGPNDSMLGARGLNENQLANRDLKEGPFGPRGFNERPFDNQGPGGGDGYFGPQGSTDRFFGSRGSAGGPNDMLYMSRNRADDMNRSFGGRGPGEFRPRGQFEGTAYPSMMRDRPDASSFGFKPNDMRDLDRSTEKGGTDNRGDGGCDSDRPMMEGKEKVDQNTDQHGWRQSFLKNSFGDIDQRPTREAERTSLGSGDMFSQNLGGNTDQRSMFGMNKSNAMPDKMRSDKSMVDSPTIASLAGSDYGKFASPNSLFAKRSMDNRQSQARCPTVKEFCIEKQFNYNHGGGTVDKKFTEHVPVKVIDYAHTSRPSVPDRLAPVQCFDYGHGNLKPVVPDRESQPKKDFRNWEESEQNLKEYTERIRRYEHYVRKRDTRRPTDYNQRREAEGPFDERRSDREKREKEEYKMKERIEERIYERKPEKDQDTRYQNDRSSNKERVQEICEAPQKESNKDHEKVDDRSKGSINWQDSSNKNIIETKPQESSVSDSQHNVLEPPPKTLELAKTPNCTMVDDLLCPPGRQNRPPKIAIILRGPPGSGKSFVAKLIKDKEVEQGGSAPRILSLDDYFLVEKEVESKDDNGKKVTVKEMVYEYEEAMEQSYVASLVKAFKKNITDGFFNFIILDCINEKISDYEEMWSFAKTKGFKVYVCEMEMDLQICLKRNIHNRTEEEINRIIDYFEPTPSYHQKLDVNSMLQEQAIEEVHMEDSQELPEKITEQNEDSQDSQEDAPDTVGVSKWERMEAEDKLDRLDGLAKKKGESKVQTMKDFLQVPDYYNMEDTSGKKRVRWADLEERKEQEKMRAVGFVVGHTNWDRMMDPTKGGSALTRTKFFSLS